MAVLILCVKPRPKLKDTKIRCWAEVRGHLLLLMYSFLTIKLHILESLKCKWKFILKNHIFQKINSKSKLLCKIHIICSKQPVIQGLNSLYLSIHINNVLFEADTLFDLHLCYCLPTICLCVRQLLIFEALFKWALAVLAHYSGNTLVPSSVFFRLCSHFKGPQTREKLRMPSIQ